MMYALVYIVPLSLITFALGYGERNQRNGVPLQEFILFSMPLLLLVVLRGDVGTDTATYIDQLKLRLSGDELIYGDFEPGFEWFSRGLLFLTQNARLSVNLLSLLNAILMLAVLRLWGVSPFAAACTILPAFFFEYSMNTLRIGLAFPLVVLSVLCFERVRPWIGLALLVIAVSMQYTSALLFATLYFPQFAKIRLNKTSLAMLLLVVVGVMLVSPIVIERLVAKAAFYELTEKPSSSSGVALIGFSLILALLSAKAASLQRSWQTFAIAAVMVAFQFAAFYVTQITYAGIRIQLLFFFAQILHFLRNSVCVFDNPRTNFIVFICLWALFLGWKVNSYSIEDSANPSPFLPYAFFFLTD